MALARIESGVGRRGLAGCIVPLAYDTPDDILKRFCEVWSSRGMPHTTSDVIARLGRVYTIVDEVAIRQFLEERPELTEALEDAPGQIVKHFFDVSLDLEVSADPEDDEHLVLWIRSREAPANAVRHLLDMTRTWWAEAKRSLDGDLVIALA